MRSWISGLLAASAIIAAPVVASASSLQITPINIEVPAPGAASTVTLNNPGADTVNAQIRIFKWIQNNGEDELIPTKDVVASPPAAKLAPGKKSVIRVVRLGKTPAAAEETYRLIVDELPKPVKAGSAGVGFSVRDSIPVFFSKAGNDANLSWHASVVNGQLVLRAGWPPRPPGFARNRKQQRQDHQGGRGTRRLCAWPIIAAMDRQGRLQGSGGRRHNQNYSSGRQWAY